jgi:hypothetical protein
VLKPVTPVAGFFYCSALTTLPDLTHRKSIAHAIPFMKSVYQWLVKLPWLQTQTILNQSMILELLAGQISG